MTISRIVAMGSLGVLASAAVHAGSTDLESAQLAFHRNCAACHSLDKGENKIGPSLYGVYGRKAASMEGYSYSEALRQLNAVWSDTTLDAYTSDAQKLAPSIQDAGQVLG